MLNNFRNFIMEVTFLDQDFLLIPNIVKIFA